MVVEEEEDIQKDFDWSMQNMVELFYASSSLLALTRDERVQQAFESLVTLFHKVALKEIFLNEVGMI